MLANKLNKKKIVQIIPKLKTIVETNSYNGLKKIRCFPWSLSQLQEAKTFALFLLTKYTPRSSLESI